MSENSVHYLDLKSGDIIFSNGKVLKVGKGTTIEPLVEECRINVCLDGNEINIVNLDAVNIKGKCSCYC